MSDGDLCQCPRCGRMHRHLQAGTPPAAISQAPEVALGRAQMARAATLLLAAAAPDSFTKAELGTLRKIAGWAEAGESELWRRARAVVDARYKPGGSWEELKDAIGNLADLVGGGEL